MLIIRPVPETKQEVSSDYWFFSYLREFERTLFIARPAHLVGLLTLFGHLIYSFRSFRVLDYVVTQGGAYGLAVALFLKMTNLRSPRLIIIDIGMSSFTSNRAGEWVTDAVLTWLRPQIGKVVCFSRSECRFWEARVPSKSYFIRFGTAENQVEERYPNTYGEYIFSGGRTGRDYLTLIGACGGMKTHVLVAGGKEFLRMIERHDTKPNITALPDISYTSFVRLMREARVVVIPLFNLAYPTGQSMLVDAMAMGKPVIATRCSGTVDYVKDGQNGILVNPRDTESLRREIDFLINDRDIARDMGSNAAAFAAKYLSYESMANSFLKLIESL
jgi:glycosyltransferase involved in cell wall biosynthesis